MRKLLWVAAALALLAAVWFLARPGAVKVDFARVVRGPIRATVDEEGRTRVVERYLVSMPVAGRVRRIGLKEGASVGEGEVVAEIDPLELRGRVAETEARIDAIRHRREGVATKLPKEEERERARVLEAQATEALDVAQRELEAARAALVKAQKDLVRTKAALESGTGSSEDVDAAEAEEVRAREEVGASVVRVQIRELEIRACRLDTRILEARLKDFEWEEKDYAAQIASLDATLATLKDDLSRTRIASPAKGAVLQVLLESEQVVQAGTPLLEIGDLARLEVEADYLSEDAAHMREGMPAEIFGRALGDRVIAGRIRRIHPSAFMKISSLGVEQQRVTVVVAFGPGEVPLGDRFRVEVRVVLDERADVLLVPEGALFRVGGDWHAFAVEGGRARQRKVETGLRDGRRREVLAGLREGETVVLHPESIGDGTKVEPLPGAPPE
ncbi:MAG: efflux RND transporter periplasmic adaptor subunit [Planctomycetes bacterium]|nr:efflux RND transporter periplasmic adaptor subunit [Planctomycetota bacterium]